MTIRYLKKSLQYPMLHCRDSEKLKKTESVRLLRVYNLFQIDLTQKLFEH